MGAVRVGVAVLRPTLGYRGSALAELCAGRADVLAQRRDELLLPGQPGGNRGPDLDRGDCDRELFCGAASASASERSNRVRAPRAALLFSAGHASTDRLALPRGLRQPSYRGVEPGGRGVDGRRIPV